MNPPATSSSFPAPRVAPNAGHAFGGIWRLTARRFFTLQHWLALGAMLAILALIGFGASSGRSGPERYVAWMAGFYVCFLVPIFAFISGAGALRDDLKAGSVDYLFTRPVRRPLFVAFRYVAHVVCAQVDFILALGVLLAVGVWRGAPGLVEAVPLLLLGQALVIVAFAAFGFFSGMLTSRYVILGLIYGGVVEIGIGNIPTQLSRLSIIRQVMGLLRPLMRPDDAALAGPMAAEWIGGAGTVGLALVFALVMLTGTALVFSWREFAGNAARDA